jgi:hypothetical protein
MPEKCVVPRCNKTKGHRFPKDPSLRLQWCVAIKRLKENAPGEKCDKLWEPKTGREIVCSEHFLPTDYRPATYGTLGEDICFK